MSPFLRHIDACNAPPPEPLLPFRLSGAPVGLLAPAIARALDGAPGIRCEAGQCSLQAAPESPQGRSDALAALAQLLAERGHIRLRGEAFDVRARPEGPVLATLDRGALPAFGIAASGVHLNGLVRRDGGLHLWVGIRARTKAVAPGKLDNLVAGGTPAGHDAWDTLLKEAAEEASLPRGLAERARPTGRITYAMWTAQGLRRDTLHCFDLDLPEGFVPRPNDGEVERFELWPATRLLAAVRDTEDLKFNVNLVLIDLFLREGLIDPASEAGRSLRAGLTRF